MLNFRRLKQDFAPSVVKEGQASYQGKLVDNVKIVSLSGQTLRLAARVQGAFENTYECEIEIDRQSSTIIDSNCDCPYTYDCQHLSAVLFFLEENLDAILVRFGSEENLEEKIEEPAEKVHIQETIKKAKVKESQRKGLQQQKELLQEYIGAADVLGRSPFFLKEEGFVEDKAELALILMEMQTEGMPKAELQIALRLPFRSKPLNIPNIKEFFNAIHYNEPIYINSKRFYFTSQSFEPSNFAMIELLSRYVIQPEKILAEKGTRFGLIALEHLGEILSNLHDQFQQRKNSLTNPLQPMSPDVPYIFFKTLEEPLKLSLAPAQIIIDIEFLDTGAPKLLLNPTIDLSGKKATLEQIMLFECAKPGLIHEHHYYRFEPEIKRRHLKDLEALRSITIPEPLFGTFVENSLPEILRFAEVRNKDRIDHLITLPYVETLSAECDLSYLNGELEASLQFIYSGNKIPSASSKLSTNHLNHFIMKDGILARNLTEEQKIIEDLFQDFIFDPAEGTYTAKMEKKIVEFMTDVIPRNQSRIQFVCPENLLDQFIYDETVFSLHLKESSKVDMFEIHVGIEGDLEGVSVSTLWECVSSKKPYIELTKRKAEAKKRGKPSSDQKAIHKILVLDLEKLTPLIQLFDEIGIEELKSHISERPLWNLANIKEEHLSSLPLAFSMTDKLKEIQEQILGTKEVMVREVPKEIKAELRSYQIEGANWLERLRNMHLNGILADDMGLGKTLQAIVVLTQQKLDEPKSQSLIVCPTSLVYNWKEEIQKFNPNLRVLIVDGIPNQRKKLIDARDSYDILVTSYSLLQKDIDHYQQSPFAYILLDEAQHIKNRGTRNAKSVKQVQAKHKLILTGTPIENSLDELWSLFDFLMPGLLSTYDRFVEKYIRTPHEEKEKNINKLKQKVSPFILRRMKKDVLSELPDVSEIVYYCHLTDAQKELYRSYAESARRELSQLVQKEGFDKVQIHVLATLTRLKQICCHPAIFAKEAVEEGDSAKYDLLQDLLQNLIEGNHKTVVFSQYTRMLNIISRDLKKKGIAFEYLDGSTKNRLDIVNRFNEDEKIPIFLVSLKAGGVGLNLVGADTVVHYDMWWNPAVENQATDRVHRIGQKNSVSSYKLITLNTIEEKILEMQNRKRGLVKKIVSTDEEAISKLTWEEVLELLQT
ncbi:DEAD/DEAH box helicase [Estrella lausannensis]|uniref:SWI/SNF family helicase n=1 Tax=Estrella lausannensis TaxID=483423 RepID=A0A0H5DS38_9BACT|nr:DEAD/DEAH box helicase [Estrella lausannensis]CRX39068.1 SWI/SNF family helicase [Estrella lausannensis]